jgi:nucleotide-binding universal stress UspA family protein
MFQHIVVPIDGSEESWRAIQVGAALALQADADMQVLHVTEQDVDLTRTELRTLLDDHLRELHGDACPTTTLTVVPIDGDVVTTITEFIDSHPGSTLVMSTIGRGRAAALVGSVAEQVVRTTFGPIVAVGPHVDPESARFTGEFIVAVDGSHASETSLPLAAAWGITLGARPWVVAVGEPIDDASSDSIDSAYPSRLAKELQAESHHDVEFEVLYNDDPAEALGDFAHDIDAAFIVMSTHARTGMARFVNGSVAMDVVRHSTIPVVLHHPPHTH